jgi:hypothetical protein
MAPRVRRKKFVIRALAEQCPAWECTELHNKTGVAIYGVVNDHIWILIAAILGMKNNPPSPN